MIKLLSPDVWLSFFAGSILMSASTLGKRFIDSNACSISLRFNKSPVDIGKTLRCDALSEKRISCIFPGTSVNANVPDVRSWAPATTRDVT